MKAMQLWSLAHTPASHCAVEASHWEHIEHLASRHRRNVLDARIQMVEDEADCLAYLPAEAVDHIRANATTHIMQMARNSYMCLQVAGLTGEASP